MVLDVPAADVEANQPAVPIDLPDQPRCKKHLVARPPLADVDPDMADAPVGVVDDELLDMTHHVVTQTNAMADDGLDAAQMIVAAAQACRARHWQMPFRGQPVLDLPHREMDRQPAAHRIGSAKGRGRQQHLVTRQPAARIDHEPAQSPRRVVEQQVAHGPGLSVDGHRCVAHHRASITQHGALLCRINPAPSWPGIAAGEPPGRIASAQCAGWQPVAAIRAETARQHEEQVKPDGTRRCAIVRPAGAPTAGSVYAPDMPGGTLRGSAARRDPGWSHRGRPWRSTPPFSVRRACD